MAPAPISPTAPQSNPIPKSKSQSVPLSIFPDGIKTSGQHPPLYDQLRPYRDFPEEITGPTVWNANDYRNNPERWTHHLSEDEIEELGAAADKFKADGIPLTGISKVPAVPYRLQYSKRDVGLNVSVGEFPSSHPLGLPPLHPLRTPQRQRLHRLQRFPN